MKKAKITLEISDFLASTGISAALLAREAKVHPARISVLLNGKQADILSETADSLRDAMKRLIATPTTASQASGGDAAETLTAPQ